MVLLWIGIALGVALFIVLSIKYTKTSKFDYVKINLHCESCGDKTNGFKCPKCEMLKKH